MRILVACEYTGRVRDAFRQLGFDAWSCDIKPNNNKYHIQCDVADIINEGWDCLIAFPPCTYLTVAANKYYNIERYGDKARERHKLREKAIAFFMLFVNADIHYIAIENPIGIMSTHYRKPDQIVQPYFFGDKWSKKTCLWLKNLPKLKPTKIVEPEYILFRSKKSKSGYSKYSKIFAYNALKKDRDKTPIGLANAMAEQWGNFLITREH